MGVADIHMNICVTLAMMVMCTVFPDAPHSLISEAVFPNKMLQVPIYTTGLNKVR